MAKKKDEGLSYLQIPVPEARKYYTMTKRSWSGYNRRYTIDTGELSFEKNISTAEAPYLTPSEKREEYASGYYGNGKTPISLFGFDGFLIVIYYKSGKLFVDYITEENGEKTVYTGILNSNATQEDTIIQRSVVQFNVYKTGDDIINGEYEKRLLIFPDRKSMYFEKDELLGDGKNKTGYDFKLYDMNSSAGFPDIKYAAVHLSRLFGVGDDMVYASGFNDYTNWELDTADEYSENNAWCSQAQANTKANSDFTGITVYQNHVVAFKKGYMHELYNTKNPFRIQDIYAEGTIDNRTVQEVDGQLIFVSGGGVKIYTGANPRDIGYSLGIDKFTYAVSGTDGRNYYLYCDDGTAETTPENAKIFVYDTYTGEWSEQAAEKDGDGADVRFLGFAHNKNGLYTLSDTGVIYRLNTGNYNHSWCFETDLITNQTADIKHLKKLQMLCDLGDEASVKVYILYDNEKFDENVSHLAFSGGGGGTKAIRIKPRQTAHYGMKLHIEGYGYAKLYEAELMFEAGGDLYV